MVFTTDVSGGGLVVILPTDSHRGVPEYGRWQGYPFDFSLCTYVSVHKYEVILAWDVAASFLGFKTTPTSLSIYWTLPDTIAWDKLKTASWPCLFNDWVCIGLWILQRVKRFWTRPGRVWQTKTWVRTFLSCLLREGYMCRETRQARTWADDPYVIFRWDKWMDFEGLWIDDLLIITIQWLLHRGWFAPSRLWSHVILLLYPGENFLSNNYTFHLHFDSMSLCSLSIGHLVGAPTIQHKYGATIAPGTIGNDELISANRFGSSCS